MTYTLINLVFLLPATGFFAWVLARGRLSWLGCALCLVGLVVLTVVFDNLMIAAGLFYYDTEHTSGITLGRMPVEDLAYVVFTALALPALWSVLRSRGS